MQIPCQPQKQALGGIGATADVSKCFRYSYAPLDCSISKRFLHVGIFLLLFPPKPHPNRQSNDRTEPGKAAVRPGSHHQSAAERPAHNQFQDRADERGPGHRAGCRRGEDFQDGGTRTCGRFNGSLFGTSIVLFKKKITKKDVFLATNTPNGGKKPPYSAHTPPRSPTFFVYRWNVGVL